MSEEEDQSWEDVIKDVTPMAPKKVVLTPPKRFKYSVQKMQTVAAKPMKHTLQLNGTSDIDRRTFERLKRGELPVEGVLDLHHQTEDKAYEMVRRFVTESYLGGKRCVIIITGKGLHQQDEFAPRGCLKNRVPQWLQSDELKSLILTYVHPRENQGGEGALMLLLRRRRD